MIEISALRLAPTRLLLAAFILLQLHPITSEAETPGYAKTTLLPDKEVMAIANEISGLIAKDTIAELTRHHRVQASSGFSSAAEYIASKAKEYGLAQVLIEHFPADGQKTYYTLKSTPGWEAERGELWETAPRALKVADYAEMRVALADYSQTADVTADLVDVGQGLSPTDYQGKEVKGRIVLAGGSLADVHKMACEEHGAAGILSFQPNQVTAWSGDYADNVRWGHLSPYNRGNKFAFMISLRRAREYQDRLAKGQRISLRAVVKAEIRAAAYDVVTAVIPGTELAGEEIVYSCHLCHQKPGANDNASGAAAILEVARTISLLIRRGEIERPRRTIRFIWPPEINGTLAYFAEHPEVVSRMKAAIHCDMVGGDYSITKSVFHATHAPASLPSFVDTVGDVFLEYVLAGSVKAAMGAGDEDALISPGGSKDSLVADITPYEMGSDHDVYQEGSFRIPTIYLRDWPDVFIHTNNDLLSNIDSTKMKRSSFVAAASGYFMARAGAKEAARLAEEIFARALARVPRENERARTLEAAGGEGGDEARNQIARSLEHDAAEISSVQVFAREDRGLEARVVGLIDQLSGAWLILTGQLTEQQKGKRVYFVLEPREQTRLRDSKDQKKSNNPKDAARSANSGVVLRRVPTRKLLGPMNVYYYDYLGDRATPAEMRVVERIRRASNGDIILYEILNLVDGKRSVQEIRDYISAAYGAIPVGDVLDYLMLLQKTGVVTLD